MNIRIPNAFESLTGSARDIPGQAEGRRPVPLGRMLLWSGVALIVAIVLGLAIYSIFFGGKPHRQYIAPVIVQKAVTADLSVTERTIGTVVSPATVQVTARVQGQILKAFFAEGQSVHKGDLLFQIDPGPYRAAYNNAMAVLGTARSKWDRYDRLMAQKAVAPQDADDARAAYLQAKSNVDAAKLNLDYTEIRSPIDGKTGPILIQPGNQVMATAGSGDTVGGTSASASTLVVITEVHPVKISFALPQADLPRIQKRMQNQGMAVTLAPQGGGDPIAATVDFVGNQVNDQTGTIELRTTLPNLNDALVPGQLVDVTVVLDTVKGALTVPHDAINLGPSSSFVYVVRNGHAQMVPIKVISDDGTTAAITANIRTGEQIIVDGQLKVVPGKAVSISGQKKK